MPTPYPLEYTLELIPDMSSFQFKGRVNITFKADTAAEKVELNLLELAVWQCYLQSDDQWVPLSFSVDPKHELLAIQLPEAISGEFILRIDYEGFINDKMSGFYRSRFIQDGETRYLAVTQFQESSARQAFPCIDQPKYKAVFNLTLTVPQDLAVIANTLPIQTDLLEDGLKRVQFEPSPKMSTYLVFFGVGAFEKVQDEEDPRVQVRHLPGLAHTTKLGLTFGRQALHYCEEFYGIEYPLSKMDLIAVPDFAFGAMENWGAITFRENLLLHFPELTSKAGIQRICEVIAHEIAHQWFGNLVTPEDWKYLWLNESFATYFGYGAVAHYYPQWEVWQQFLNTETATALTRDGLKETFAIEIPGGEHVVINSSTAPIIYNKGASIMRMIEGYIGHENYRNGVRAYLDEHRYGCTQSHHLWRAFEEASSQPITAMMQSWIEQPGHPLVTARQDGRSLTLEQKRFSYLPGAFDQTWVIPMTLTSWAGNGQARKTALLMDKATLALELPVDTVCFKLNDNQTGFFRVEYANAQNLKALGEKFKKQVIGPQDRWGIQNDLYAMVRAGRAKLEDYLDFLNYYNDEDAYLPLTSICSNLSQAFLILADGETFDIAEKGCAITLSALDRMGFLPDENEPFTNALLRDQLLWQAVQWEAERARAFSGEQFQMLMSDAPVHPDIAKSVLQAGAFLHGEKALDWLRLRFGQSPSEHERLNILQAFGALPTWSLTEQALAFTLEHVPPRNRYIPIASAAVNPVCRPHLWNWYLKHLTTLETFHPLLYERVITSIWPWGGMDYEEDVRNFAEKYTSTHPHLSDAVTLALENLAIHNQMRRS